MVCHALETGLDVEVSSVCLRQRQMGKGSHTILTGSKDTNQKVLKSNAFRIQPGQSDSDYFCTSASVYCMGW